MFLSLQFLPGISSFFFFNDAATTEIYTLSLHDALPILAAATPLISSRSNGWNSTTAKAASTASRSITPRDRKSTRLNSSHANISYAVFCLKKKTKQTYSDILKTQDEEELPRIVPTT